MNNPNKVTKLMGGTTPIVLSPPTYNRFARAADFVEDQKNRVGIPVGQFPPQEAFASRAVEAKNLSGSDITRGEALRLTNVALKPDPSDDRATAAFLDEWRMTAVNPQLDAGLNRDPVGIALHSIPTGKYGLFSVGTFIVPCWATLPHADVESVGVDYNAVAGLEARLVGGLPGFPIVWMDRSTFAAGDQWCLVQAMPRWNGLVAYSTSLITGRSGNTEGSGTVDLKYRDWATGDLTTWVGGVTVRNWVEAELPVDTYYYVDRDWTGQWQVVAQECEDPTGYAGMTMSTPTAGSDLGAGWNPLDYFDSNLHPDVGGIITDPVTGRFTFTEPAWWDVQLQGNFSHNSDNGGRTTNLRLYNTVGLAPIGNEFPLGIGRQQQDTAFNLTLRVQIDAGNTNEIIRFEVGGGDSVTSVMWNNLACIFTRVS